MESPFFLIDNFLHVGGFPTCVCDCRRRQIDQKLVHRWNISCRLIFELIGCVIFVAEKFGAFRSKLCGADDHVPSVERAAFTVAGERCLHDALANFSVLQRRKRGLPRRVLKAQYKLAFLVLIFGGGDGRGDLIIGKSGKVFSTIDNHGGSVLFL